MERTDARAHGRTAWHRVLVLSVPLCLCAPVPAVSQCPDFIRHEASRKAWITRREYIKLGITRIHGLKELDKVLGVEEGHTKDRLATRRLFWEEKHGFLPPSAVEYHQDHTGAVFYTDVDGEIWRAYTVDGKLFWTRSISLAGYETAEELTSRYGTLTGHSVQIHF